MNKDIEWERYEKGLIYRGFSNEEIQIAKNAFEIGWIFGEGSEKSRQIMSEEI